MNTSADFPKTFLLGLGCQKGGTTWVHDYLNRHPQVKSGFAKEYHALDQHFQPAFREVHDERIARIDALIRRLRRLPGVNRERRIQQLTALLEQRERQKVFARDLDGYCGYFAELAGADASTRLVYDITPSYACLSGAELAEVRARLEHRGLEPRALFIMRDPIERAFSAYRMRLSRADRYATWPISPRLAEAQLHLDSWARLSAARVRQRLVRTAAAKQRQSPFLRFALRTIDLHCSSYHRTIEAVEAAFPPQRIHYGFFETLFRPESVRAITDFAGLDFEPAPYDRSRNASAVRLSMTPFEIATLREAFADTYRFCADRFGADFIRSLWRHY